QLCLCPTFKDGLAMLPNRIFKQQDVRSFIGPARLCRYPDLGVGVGVCVMTSLSITILFLLLQR
ncbi:MAG: hypothetical protein M3512_16790, partial [Bacteroidota bacterium]|nr:hypothetical protein [Bacteroidota bacterium]